MICEKSGGRRALAIVERMLAILEIESERVNRDSELVFVKVESKCKTRNTNINANKQIVMKYEFTSDASAVPIVQTKSAQKYAETDENLGIFLGGSFGAIFAIWSISSHVGVQIGLELVRLIALICLNKFWTNVTPPKSLKKFSRTTFR